MPVLNLIGGGLNDLLQHVTSHPSAGALAGGGASPLAIFGGP
jgi:hypothetical protein